MKEKMRVLVVDDDEIVREMIACNLEDEGYDVATAENGEVAIEMLRTGSFRLVVSDWVMPGMSGEELCRAIRQRDYGRYVYVIVVTSRRDTEDIVAAFDAGADDFISKPVHPAELSVRLRVGERVLAMENRDVTILALAKIADSRDPETGAHLERIREYCRILARDLARHEEFSGVLDGEYIEAIYATSPLHDIGKVGIPDDILLKDGPLTADEYEQIKKHALIGAQALDATLTAHPDARFLQIAKEIALNHHEKWDGSGYPNGLRGDEIPLAAQIVAVADVYDALTTERSYKPAFPHKTAKDMIVKNSGSHFNPLMVEAFLRNEESFEQTSLRFSDQTSKAPKFPAIEGLNQIPNDGVPGEV